MITDRSNLRSLGVIRSILKFFDTIADKWGYWGPLLAPGGLLALGLSWLARTVEPIAHLGWGAIIIFGIFLSCICMFAVAALLLSWHKIRAKPPKDHIVEPKSENIEKISEIAISKISTHLRLNFVGGQRAPIEMRSENVLSWYVIWSGDVDITFSNAKGEKERPFEVPKTWVILLIFDRPTIIRQVVIEPASLDFPRHEIKFVSSIAMIATTFGADPPPGIVDIYVKHD